MVCVYTHTHIYIYIYIDTSLRRCFTNAYRHTGQAHAHAFFSPTAADVVPESFPPVSKCCVAGGACDNKYFVSWRSLMQCAKISLLSDGSRLSLSLQYSQNFFSVGWPPTLATPCVHSLGEPSQGAEPARAAPILVGSGHPPSSSPGALDFRILLPLSKTNFAYHFLCNSTFPGLGAPGPRFRDLGTLSPPSPEPLDSRILLPLSKK